jgi:hypothetical protein
MLAERGLIPFGLLRKMQKSMQFSPLSRLAKCLHSLSLLSCSVWALGLCQFWEVQTQKSAADKIWLRFLTCWHRSANNHAGLIHLLDLNLFAGACVFYHDTFEQLILWDFEVQGNGHVSVVIDPFVRLRLDFFSQRI